MGPRALCKSLQLPLWRPWGHNRRSNRTPKEGRLAPEAPVTSHFRPAPPPAFARRILYRGPKHLGRVGQWQPLARSAPQASARSVHCVAESDPRPDRAQPSVGESSTRAATYGPCGSERPMPQPRSRSGSVRAKLRPQITRRRPYLCPLALSWQADLGPSGWLLEADSCIGARMAVGNRYVSPI